MEARAIAKTVRIAPRKARLVVDLVRNKSVIEADKILANLNKEAARITRKVLTSAVANAENNLGLDKNNLYFLEDRVLSIDVLDELKDIKSLSAFYIYLIFFYKNFTFI